MERCFEWMKRRRAGGSSCHRLRVGHHERGLESLVAHVWLVVNFFIGLERVKTHVSPTTMSITLTTLHTWIARRWLAL